MTEGHNSGVDREKLDAFYARIERLEEEKAATMQDIKEIYMEAKSHGYDPKIMKIVIRRRKMEKQKREEQDELVSLYEGGLFS